MKAIFELSMLVDSKRLGEVLVQLDGKVYNLRHRLVRVQDEVVMTEPELTLQATELANDLPRRRGRSRGANVQSNRAHQYVERLKSEGVSTFTTKQMSDTIGIQRNYTSTLLSEMVRSGRLRRVRSGMYEVL